ncbi:MAG: WG repeat-containing protein [Achromobacter pestifer]
MLSTLLFSLLAAVPAGTAAFDLNCHYAQKDEGGMIESAEHCARLAEDTLVFRPEVLRLMDYNADGLSPVFVNRSWHWVRPDGKSAAVLTYDNFADDFEAGLTRGPWSGGMAYYDTQLNRVLATPYEWVDRFSGGLAVVCEGCRKMLTPDGEHSFMSGGEWGAIDRQGRLVLPLRPDAASLLREVEAARAAAPSTAG